jgi:MFS family permease
VNATYYSFKAAFAELPMAKEYGVPHEVTILSISLVVLGVGIGPLLLGPLSELYGRNIVYRISFALYVSFGLPVIFAPNIGMRNSYTSSFSCFDTRLSAVHLVFRFVTALCGSAFLSVSGGSMADMFHNHQLAG